MSSWIRSHHIRIHSAASALALTLSGPAQVYAAQLQQMSLRDTETASAQNATAAEEQAAQAWGNLPPGKLVPVLLHSAAIFLVAGVFEIGGGWLVWGSMREGRPFWWGILGGLVLAAYGVIAAAQPPGLDFGRAYAAYGMHISRHLCHQSHANRVPFLPLHPALVRALVP